MTLAPPTEFDALRSTGGGVHLRPVHPDDREALLALTAAASDRSIYLRFFGTSRQTADRYVLGLLEPGPAGRCAVVALVGGELVAVGAFVPCAERAADIGLLVRDERQHEGIGTLLIEYLAAQARSHGINCFRADVLVANGLMSRALRDLGYRWHADTEAGVTSFELDLTTTGTAQAAVDERDRAAGVASMRALLRPKSVVVIGAGERERSVGHQVLRNIQRGGYRGELWVVNPKHRQVLDVRSFESVAALPATPDLAVIAIPAASVVQAVIECGERGVGAVLVLTAGFGEIGPEGMALQRELLAAARRYGVRMVGPNCLGLLNGDPDVRLNATFAELPFEPGGLALISQSGALGISVLTYASQSGIGLAQFVSVGNKADVSSNDLLLAWEADDQVTVIALYLESLGNPARFARIARRVSATKPIVAIKAGRTEAGRRAGQSHTAAAASSDVVVDALFDQAGVIRVDSTPALIDAVRVLAGQPLPAGPRVAILGNSGGPEILAADAAAAAGLQVGEFSAALLAELAVAAPGCPSAQNPVDLGAGAQPEQVRAAAEVLLRSPEVDSLLGIFTQTLVADPAAITAALGSAAAGSDKPVLLVQVGEQPQVLAIAGSDRTLPRFSFPEPAAAAMAIAWRYSQLRAAPRPEPIRPDGVDLAGARALVQGRLASAGPGWLEPAAIEKLLACYGIATTRQQVVHTEEQALAAASALGLPVALKLADATVHKSELGGVRLGLSNAAEVSAAFTELHSLGGAAVLVQAMAAEGTEIILGGLQDQQFGPVVMVGSGGVLADLISDRAFRLAPVVSDQALQLLDGLKLARLLDGYRGRTPVSRIALAELVCRFSHLIADHPELAEVDLNPVTGQGETLIVLDAKVRVAQAPARADTALRMLGRPSY